MLVKYINESLKLYGELGPSTARGGGLSPCEQKVYDYFRYLSWKKEKVLTSFVLPFLKDQDGNCVMSEVDRGRALYTLVCIQCTLFIFYICVCRLLIEQTMRTST